MGQDIHTYLEKYVCDKWEPLFPPTFHPNYWYERILSDCHENGAGQLLIFDTDEKKSYEALENYFMSMSPEHIQEKFSDDPRVIYCWRESDYENHPNDILRGRDYRWFRLLNAKRINMPGTRTIPDDVSKIVKDEFDSGKGDYHSSSWFMVSEIITDPNFNNSKQTGWLKRHVPRAESTRMVFWFDN